MLQSLPSTIRHLGLLAKEGWLLNQPESFLNWISGAGRWVTVGPGKPLYAAGDPPDAMYGLGSGMLDVALPIDGEEEVTIYRAEPGFWIGDSAILAATSRTISIATATECRLFRIPASVIRRHLQDNPGDWQCFYLLSHLNGTMALQFAAEVLSLSPSTRFARMLLRLADNDGIVRITQEEMGKLAGMSRSTFRRSLASLGASGVIKTEYGCLRILDRMVLEKEARRSP